MSKIVTLEAHFQDELGKANNLTLTLLMKLEENKTPNMQQGGYGRLVDITDAAKGITNSFPLLWSLKGKKLLMDFGYSCENWEEAKDESPLNPLGYRYSVMELPEKIEPGQTITVMSGKVRAIYAISSILDF